jgi:hypothetical protein
MPYTDCHRAWRRLAAAMLLQACKDARLGDGAAWAWMHSAQAARWAEWLDLPQWPPRWSQLPDAVKRPRTGRRPVAEEPPLTASRRP